jgi:hypothetical protein
MNSDLPLRQQIRELRENIAHIQYLKLQLRSSLGVIPFVGAGISKPMGFPLWPDFLLQQAALRWKSATHTRADRRRTI